MKTLNESLFIIIIGSLMGFFSNTVSKGGIPLFSRPIETLEFTDVISPYLKSEKDSLEALAALASDDTALLKGPVNINSKEAFLLFVIGGSVFIDSRDYNVYKSGHIYEAVNIPLGEFNNKKNLLTRIPINRSIVVYDDGKGSGESTILAKRLVEEGFFKVFIFYGGWSEWVALNYPIEIGKKQ